MLVHGDKLRMLFWLRWKMFARSYSRRPGRAGQIFATIVMMFVMLVVMGGAGVGSFFLYRYGPTDIKTEVLFLILTGVYLFWTFAPLIAFNTNEGLDLSKLSLFPLTRTELILSLLFSTVLDIWTVGLFILFLGTIVGWGVSLPVILISILTLIVFYVQLISVSQLLLTLLLRVFQSRRLRDFSYVMVVIFGLLGYSSQFVFRSYFLEFLQKGLFSQYLQWFPPGMAAQAIKQASLGNWGSSFLWIGILLVISVAFFALWVLLVQQGLVGAESSAAVGKQVKRRSSTEIATADNTPKILSGQIGAMILKDFRYFRREPFMTLLLVQSVLITALVFGGFIFGTSNGGRGSGLPPAAIIMGAPAYVLIWLFTLASNIFGYERKSLTTLFLFPMEPRKVLFAKNIVIAIIGLVEITVFVIAGAVLTKGWEFIPAGFTVGLAGLSIVLGLGNVTSIYFPIYVKNSQRGFSNTSNMSGSAGCLRGVMIMILMVVTVIGLAPVGLMLILPLIFGYLWLHFLLIPVCLLYGALLYILVTFAVAPKLNQRVPNLLEIVAKD